ncbi:hypothetical protein FVE85_1063 [Porphyridium purpureum]|uniref:Protein ZIP4 homolog n=1 Tax=Porphyridium purpureum TaxID=35688 RepID=A0A5J4Z358_PORPP|nr:hypothetical protein FVE85_1063 [Porphyridium purpureum]|eukprot:POR2046..scf208_2
MGYARAQVTVCTSSDIGRRVARHQSGSSCSMAASVGDSEAALGELELVVKEIEALDRLETLDENTSRRAVRLVHHIRTLSSRTLAERLLQAGVGLWNAVLDLHFVGPKLKLVVSFASEHSNERAVQTWAPKVRVLELCQLKHVAADCIFMAMSLLGWVSANFDLDAASVASFYAQAGTCYFAWLNKADMTQACLKRCEELLDDIYGMLAQNSGDTDTGTQAAAQAVFDFFVLSAQCSISMDNVPDALQAFDRAKQVLVHLSDERELVASSEFNIGLYFHQQQRHREALVWLQRSVDSRGHVANPRMDHARQLRTLTVMAVCCIELARLDDAREYLRAAEQLEPARPSPVVMYLKLKVSILQQEDTDALSARALSLVECEACPFELACTVLHLLSEHSLHTLTVMCAQRLLDSDACVRGNWERRHKIAMRMTEALFASAGAVEPAIACFEQYEDDLVGRVASVDNESNAAALSLAREWIGVMLQASRALHEKQDHLGIALTLHSAFRFIAFLAPTVAASKGSDGTLISLGVEEHCFLVHHCILALHNLMNLAPVRTGSDSASPADADVEPQTPAVRAGHASPMDLTDRVSMATLRSDFGGGLIQLALAHARRAKALSPRSFLAVACVFRTLLFAGALATASADEDHARERGLDSRRLSIQSIHTTEALQELKCLSMCDGFSVSVLCDAARDAKLLGLDRVAIDCFIALLTRFEFDHDEPALAALTSLPAGHENGDLSVLQRAQLLGIVLLAGVLSIDEQLGISPHEEKEDASQLEHEPGSSSPAPRCTGRDPQSEAQIIDDPPRARALLLQLKAMLDAGLKVLATYPPEQCFAVPDQEMQQSREAQAPASGSARTSLVLLTNIAWNAAIFCDAPRVAGEDDGDACEGFQPRTDLSRSSLRSAFFDLSYAYGAYQTGSDPSLEAQMLARILSVCATLENNAARAEQLVEALNKLRDARRLLGTLQRLREGTCATARTSDQDPAEKHIMFLECACHLRLFDADELKVRVENMVEKAQGNFSHEGEQHQHVAMMENLGARCLDIARTPSTPPGFRVFCEEICIVLLRCAIQVRLQRAKLAAENSQSGEGINVEAEAAALTAALREGSSAACGRQVSSAAEFVELAFELATSATFVYPKRELQWLVAFCWSNASTMHKSGRIADAHMWADFAKRVCEAQRKCPSLSGALPLIDELLAKCAE